MLKHAYNLWCCWKHKFLTLTWLVAIITFLHWLWHLIPIVFGFAIGSLNCGG